jgi:hypothetical protein
VQEVLLDFRSEDHSLVSHNACNVEACDAQVANACAAVRAALPRLALLLLPTHTYTYKSVVGLMRILAGTLSTHFH